MSIISIVTGGSEQTIYLTARTVDLDIVSARASLTASTKDPLNWTIKSWTSVQEATDPPFNRVIPLIDLDELTGTWTSEDLLIHRRGKTLVFTQKGLNAEICIDTDDFSKSLSIATHFLLNAS